MTHGGDGVTASGMGLEQMTRTSLCASQLAGSPLHPDPDRRSPLSSDLALPVTGNSDPVATKGSSRPDLASNAEAWPWVSSSALGALKGSQTKRELTDVSVWMR